MGCPPVNSPVRLPALKSYLFKSLPRISIPRVGIVPPHVAYSRVGCDFSDRPTRADEGGSPCYAGPFPFSRSPCSRS